MRYFHPTPPLLCRRSPAPSRPRHLRWHWPAPWLWAAAPRRLAQAHLQPNRPLRLRHLPFRPSPGRASSPAAADGHEEGLFNGAMPLPRRRWLKAFGPTRCATCWPRPNGSPRHQSWTDRSPNSRARPGRIWTAPCHPARQPGPCQLEQHSTRCRLLRALRCARQRGHRHLGHRATTEATSAPSKPWTPWPRWPMRAAARLGALATTGSAAHH